MDQGSNKNHSPAYNFTPTVTKFCVMWEGLSLPHDTRFGNCRCKIVDSRSFHSWSLIHGLRWSGLIKVGPVHWGIFVVLGGDELIFIDKNTYLKVFRAKCRVHFSTWTQLYFLMSKPITITCDLDLNTTETKLPRFTHPVKILKIKFWSFSCVIDHNFAIRYDQYI